MKKVTLLFIWIFLYLSISYAQTIDSTFTPNFTTVAANSQVIIQPDDKRQVANTTTFQVRPNPFYQSTFIDYTLEKSQPINLAIYDLTGQLVKTILHSKIQKKGIYSYELGTENLKPGMYIVVLTTEQERLSKKSIFLQ